VTHIAHRNQEAISFVSISCSKVFNNKMWVSPISCLEFTWRLLLSFLQFTESVFYFRVYRTSFLQFTEIVFNSLQKLWFFTVFRYYCFFHNLQFFYFIFIYFFGSKSLERKIIFNKKQKAKAIENMIYCWRFEN